MSDLISTRAEILPHLQQLATDYRPSPYSVSRLEEADLILVAGEIVGAGKSTLIKRLGEEGMVNLPSWTNRQPRESEIDGVDKHFRTLTQMAKAAEEGYFLEIEELRSGSFYATPSDFKNEERYVKDIGLVVLPIFRKYKPDIITIIPIPPVDIVYPSMVSEWEKRVIERAGYRNITADTFVEDLEDRLKKVILEIDYIFQHKLTLDPNVLIVLNYQIVDTLNIVSKFVQERVKQEDESIENVLHSIRQLAQTALAN